MKHDMNSGGRGFVDRAGFGRAHARSAKGEAGACRGLFSTEPSEEGAERCVCPEVLFVVLVGFPSFLCLAFVLFGRGKSRDFVVSRKKLGILSVLPQISFAALGLAVPNGGGACGCVSVTYSRQDKKTVWNNQKMRGGECTDERSGA